MYRSTYIRNKNCHQHSYGFENFMSSWGSRSKISKLQQVGDVSFFRSKSSLFIFTTTWEAFFAKKYQFSNFLWLFIFIEDFIKDFTKDFIKGFTQDFTNDFQSGFFIKDFTKDFTHAFYPPELNHQGGLFCEKIPIFYFFVLRILLRILLTILQVGFFSNDFTKDFTTDFNRIFTKEPVYLQCPSGVQ